MGAAAAQANACQCAPRACSRVANTAAPTPPPTPPTPRSLQTLGSGCQDIWGQSPLVTELAANLTALQAQVNKLQAEVDTLNGKPNSSIPFDSAACLAKNITSFKTDFAGTGAQWVAVDFFAGGSNDVCERSLALTSCSNVCARAGLTCDPCAIAKVSCQDALYYALQQAGKKEVAPVIQLREAPGPPGPWPQSVCAGPGVAQQGGFSGDFANSDKPYAKQFGWAMQQCDPTGPPIVTDFYAFQKNYWLPSLTESYIDPSTLCNLPIVTRGEFGFVMYSGLCYCSP